MKQTIQSLPYPEYSTIERDSLTNIPYGYIIHNTDNNILEMFDYSDTWITWLSGESQIPLPIGLISVTYDDLLTKVTNSELKPGTNYLITDFAQAYNIFDGGGGIDMMGQTQPPFLIEEQVGTLEPLIVTAISETELDKVAISPLYPKDIIYYSLGLLHDRDIGFGDGNGNPTVNFKGQIYFRHDTVQDNSLWYDFRNVKFRRWGATDGYKAWTQGDYESTDYQDILTFGDVENYNKARGNHIGLIDVFTFSTILNNTIFNVLNICASNIIGINCFNNTVGNVFNNNKVGDDFRYNTVGDDVGNNIVGDRFSNNTIGDAFRTNTIKSDINNIDFTLATHVYGNYDCEIFKRLDGTVRLRYTDNNDAILTVAPND